MARNKRPVTINLNVNIILPEGPDDDSEEYTELMAKVDEVQASLDELDAAVRDFLDSAGGSVNQMQQELDKLRADDAVEDSKLDGIKNGIQNITQAIKALSQTEPPEGQEPYPDNTLPGDGGMGPRPDNTLPEGGQGGTDVDPDYGIEEGQQPGAFPGDPGYNPPSGGAVPTPNTVERLAVQVFAQGQEGDWSNTAVMPNDGLAVLSYPKDFKGESYVEVRALDGSLVDSGSITVK